MVTSADVDAFRRDGVVCLRGVLPRDLLDSMAEPVETAIRSAQSADLSAMAGAPPTSARFIAGVDHWRHQPELREFACDSQLPEIVAALLRTNALYLYEDSVLVKEPGAAERTHWHQDLAYFHVEGAQLCTAWCPLDAVDEESGMLRFVRGSHMWPELYRPNLFVMTEPLPGTEGELVPDVDAGEFDLVSFALEPGDITVHHARTLHSAGSNRTADRRRRAISVRYCGDDARTHIRPGAPRKPEQAGMADGDRLGGAVHPQVWPVTATP